MEIKDKCTVLVLTYNQLEFTKSCLESVKKNTFYPYKLIVVDNNSTDGTKEWLKQNEVDFIQNERNMGFGYANNQVLRKLDTKYVCILNNDTIVTKNWLTNLIEIFEENSEAGAIGPVTNRIGSALQKVDVDCESNKIEEHISLAEKTASEEFKRVGKEILEVSRLIAYCFLTKKEVIEKVGVFDERYYPGNFEDDDLSLRMLENGYKLLVAKGVFIYHFQGSTFNKLNTSLSEILKVNRDRHYQKWYLTGRIDKSSQIRKKPKILYFIESDSPCGGVKVVYEHANRLKDLGYDVKIVANRMNSENWFDVRVPVILSKNFKDLPEHDIAIGTFYTTLNSVENSKSLLKFHLCQGYEGLYAENENILKVIKSSYKTIKRKLAVSRPLIETLQKEFENFEYYLVQNGLDPYYYIYRDDIEFKKIKNKNRIKVLITGTEVLKIKGVAEAYKAIKNFRNVEINRLSSDNCSKLKCHNFYCMPKMTQEEIVQVYKQNDIVLSASWKVEGFSLHQLESMAVGTPVISSDCGGINHYGVNEENCLIVEASPQSIRKALVRLIDDDLLYQKLSKNGIETAKKYAWHFTIDKLEEIFLNAYKDAISQKSNISLTMIVRNEEHILNRCLKSVQNLVDEIVIVDTGSTDSTIEIAKRYGAKIYNFEWKDDFSEARNYALEKATKDWVLILDADEFIDEEAVQEIRRITSKERSAYSVVTWNYFNDYSLEKWKTNPGTHVSKEEYNGYVTSEKVRLFPNNKKIFWQGEVHELVEHSLSKLKIEVKRANFIVHHSKSRKDSNKKQKYLELSELKANKGDYKSQVDLGIHYMSIRDYDNAIQAFRKSFDVVTDDAQVLAYLGVCHSIKNEFSLSEKYLKKALEKNQNLLYARKHLAVLYGKMEDYASSYKIFKEIMPRLSDDLKSLIEFGFICNAVGNFQEAIVNLEKAKLMDEKITLEKGILECSYNGLGIMFGKKGHLEEAVKSFKKAIEINTNFEEAKINLSRTLQHCEAIGMEIQ